MFATLPRRFEDAQDWQWEQLSPYVDDLLARPQTAETLDTWLTDYSRLLEVVGEVRSRLEVARTCDTTNAEIEARYLAYLDHMMPPLMEANNKLDRKLVESNLKPANFDIQLQEMQTSIAIFRDENIPLIVEGEKISSEFEKVVSEQTVQREGEERTLDQMLPLLQDADRALREKAWRIMMDRWQQSRPTINDLWQKLLPLRDRMAKNAGLPTYREYMWKAYARFGYTPQDTAAFRSAIEQAIVPAMQRLLEKRRQLLGVDVLRPWDLEVDLYAASAPLRPFQNIEEMNGKATAIFRKVDPVLGGYYQQMQDEKLLDLENRKGKAPGAYCTAFPVGRVPFIFMNAVGIHDDLQTLFHEGGHAFHAFESKNLPYIQQTNAPIEFCEVASMAMELLTAPYFAKDKGGYYTEPEAARARLEHLEGPIRFWPYMAVVDGFQDWVYLNIDAAQDPAACDQAWGDLWNRFMKGVEWSGLDAVRVTSWHRKHHIFTHPLYYVEYGLAQLGAVQVWGNSLQDPAKAIADYRRALSLGGTASLPDLLEAAGARFAFDVPTLKNAADLIEKTIEALESVL